MKGSVILSLALDVSAIGFLLIPADRFRGLSTNPKVVSTIKRAGFFLLLISGFLIDHYISHPG